MVRRFQAWIWPWKSSKRYVSFAVGCLDECSGLLVAVIVAHNSICSTVVQQKAKQLPSVHQFSCYNFKPFDLNTVITLLRRPTSHCVSQKEVLLRKSGHYWIWPALALTSVDNGKAKAWHRSRSLEFVNTLGQPYACTPDTEARKRVSQSNSQRQTYEQIDPSAANIDKDHVVVYNTAGVSDADVPLLAASAFDWNYIAAESPGFTPQMLNVADLLYKTGFELVSRLNAIMEPAGLTQVSHVSEAISRANTIFISVAEKDALELALDTFFTEIAGDHALECRQQWHICINWMRTRLAVAHPLSCSNPSNRTQRLRQVHHAIQHEEEYELVREAAMAMTACLARTWNIAL